MTPIEIRKNIFWIGVNDHKTDLFEGLWPIAEKGVSLNSYLIRDEKSAIIDLSREIFTEDILQSVQNLTELAKIDYLVVNHMEPDHTGALLKFRQMVPGATILCSERAKKMLEGFYEIIENIRTVKDGETISLGKHTLQFFSTPNVHWPETMMTYEQEEKILFSCDAFGGFCALDVSIFDDGVEDLNLYEKEALRYFTNIVANRSKSVLNAIQKLTNLPIAIVAPSHGLIWRKKPEHIIQLYKQWSEMAFQPGDLGVTILYGSMYGGTEQLAEVIGNGLNKEGVPFIIFDIARTHISYILPSLWTKRGVLIGAPTYEGGLFPPIAAALQMAKHKKVSGKTTGYFGGFGWGGGAKNEFDLLVKELGWQPAGVLEFIGSPSEEDLQKGERFGSDFAKILLGSTL